MITATFLAVAYTAVLLIGFVAGRHYERSIWERKP
jgi:hypothetical protein